jgi:hypothetical protein
MYKVVSEYAKSILACRENTLKEDKSIWRIRQEYFAVYGEYANRHKIELISANFCPKPKIFMIQNHLSEHDRMGPKTISRYCPFKGLNLNFFRVIDAVNICATSLELSCNNDSIIPKAID